MSAGGCGAAWARGASAAGGGGAAAGGGRWAGRHCGDAHCRAASVGCYIFTPLTVSPQGVEVLLLHRVRCGLVACRKGVGGQEVVKYCNGMVWADRSDKRRSEPGVPKGEACWRSLTAFLRAHPWIISAAILPLQSVMAETAASTRTSQGKPAPAVPVGGAQPAAVWQQLATSAAKFLRSLQVAVTKVHSDGGAATGVLLSSGRRHVAAAAATAVAATAASSRCALNIESSVAGLRSAAAR